MKKFVVFLLFLIFSVGCTSEESLYTEVTTTKIKDKIQKNNKFALLISSSDCDECEKYEKKLSKIMEEYELEVFYLDESKLTEEEKRNFKRVVNYDTIPTTTFFQRGEECDLFKKIIGNKEEDYIIKIFEKNGYIEEDN